MTSEAMAEAALSIPNEELCATSHCHAKESNPCYVEFEFPVWSDKMHAVESRTDSSN